MSGDRQQLTSTAGMSQVEIVDALKRGALDEYLKTPNVPVVPPPADADQGARQG